MAKKNRVDGISLAIVILNFAIVAVIITLIVLIYMYMTGNLEKTDVANMDQESQTSAVMSTTPITTGEPETLPTESEDTTVEPGSETEPDFVVTEESGETTGEGEGDDAGAISAFETDEYDPAFFANDFFIGDSIYTGLTGYEYLPESQVFAAIGLNPESARTKTENGLTAVGKAKAMQPKRIFIMLGSNGIAFMGKTHMAEQMKLLVEELIAACPDSFIYVVSIPPVTKAHDAEGQETMAEINSYNKLLKTMAEETGVVFLDLCSKLKDNSGYFSDAYAEADGLHFLGTAYRRMFSFFQNSIQ